MVTESAQIRRIASLYLLITEQNLSFFSSLPLKMGWLTFDELS